LHRYATGHIVDAAVALGKPFAVVPCCVFANLFPERRTPDDRQGGGVTRSLHTLYKPIKCVCGTTKSHAMGFFC
jgi:hypothetical protein